MARRPLATQLVGSFSKPGWLIRHENYPFTRDENAWRPTADVLQTAQDDATLLAIYDQEDAGLDVITDGEARRARFDNYFLRYGGIDTVNLGKRPPLNDRDTSGSDIRPSTRAAMESPSGALSPRVFEKIHWDGPLSLDDLKFLKAHTRRQTKVTVLGPLTSAARVADEHYGNFTNLVMDFARTINEEVRALDDEGVDVIQIDEPDLFLRRTRTMEIGVDALNTAVSGATAQTIVHICHGYPTVAINKRMSSFYGDAVAKLAECDIDGISLEWEEPGYDEEILHRAGDKTVVLGVLNLGTDVVESVDHVASRLRQALKVVPPGRLSPAPDCGLWHLKRDVAYQKIRNMAMAAEVVRSELT